MRTTALCAGFALSVASAAEPPAAWGPCPTPLQMRWYDVGFYGFVHFGINTFTDREWGYGDESPDQFAPTDFDADQIVAAAKAGGMKGLILTCKHHDGFCLWPSRYTEHSIKNSKWRDGKGDIVRAISDACHRQGMLFGTYLSPWDRNHAEYARPAYVTYYKNQIAELMANYGPIFEMWFDGANGGDGFYGGAREKRQIPDGYYDFPGIARQIRAADPNTVIWGAGSSGDVTWGGSEAGVVPDPCWPTLNNHKRLAPGDPYVPSEADVSIRPGWFYHAAQDGQVKTAAQLADIWFASIGRGANLILNLPPDRRGRIHDNDVAALRQFKAWLDATFGTDLAAGAMATADNTRGQDPRFGPAAVLDGRDDTYWATDDGVTQAQLTVRLPKPQRVGVVRLVEAIALGQRVEQVTVEALVDGAWQPFGTAPNIGARRLMRGRPVTTDQLRISLRSGHGCIALAALSLHVEPFRLAPGEVRRDQAGQVRPPATPTGLTLRYTLDGQEPTAASAAFSEPLPLPRGGLLKVRLFAADGQPAGDSVTRSFGLVKTGWSVVSCSSEEKDGENGAAANAIDDNPDTFWHSQWRLAQPKPPHELIIDLGAEVEAGGFTYLPRQDTARGRCCASRARIWLSATHDAWGEPLARASFDNIAANPIEQVVRFAGATRGRYLRVVFDATADGEAFVTAAEVGLVP
ncbi:MAG: alpha-L-fucosidase [Armatimonadetes bacterium]|nr:alpha-L-fucosidase [Armatimonadota bacterium]